MRGEDVHRVLKQIGATKLHHANSVLTSTTFLEQSGLASRGFVADCGLKQTAQPSDNIDQRFGIWHDVFLDHVDIHRRTRSPNYYGPVLFALDLDILLALPNGAEALVTKDNPTKWRDNQPDSERWFESPEELQKTIKFGDFGKMVVLRIPSGKLDFSDRKVEVLLDDPHRQLSANEDCYVQGENRLRKAALAGKVKASIGKYPCSASCKCAQKYADWADWRVRKFFG